jgi:VCBS repeat-containing protein
LGRTNTNDLESYQLDYTAPSEHPRTSTNREATDTHSVKVKADDDNPLGGKLVATVQSNASSADGTVTWTYKVDNSATQHLAEGQTVTETFKITIDDKNGGKDTQFVTVTITGDNDAPTIVSSCYTDVLGAVVEDDPDQASTSGKIVFKDVDLTDDHTANITDKSTDHETGDESEPTFFGTFTLTPVHEGHGGHHGHGGHGRHHGGDDDHDGDHHHHGRHNGRGHDEHGNGHGWGHHHDHHGHGSSKGSLGWTYTIDPEAAQSLAEGETVTEIYTVTIDDGNGGTVTQDVVITITGTNDAATISGEASGAATEDASDPTLTATGTLAVADVDQGEDVFDTGSVTDTTVDGALGSLGITASGEWTYTVANTEVQYLGFGDTRVETFTVASADGSDTETITITITITGTNDAPTLAASVSSGSYNDTSIDNTFASIDGTLTVTDIDVDDTHAFSISGGGTDNSLSGFTHSKLGTYGSLYVNELTGAYRFVPSDAAIEGLKSNTSEGFTFVVTDAAGATGNATFTITLDGANDPPTISATLNGTGYTDTANNDTFTAVAGDLNAADRDNPETTTFSIDGQAVDGSLVGYTHSKVGGFGKLYIDANSGNYTYLPNDAAIEGIKANQVDTFTLRVTDGSGATDTTAFTVNITGANDTAAITVTAGGDYSVTEAGTAGAGDPSASGDLDVSDRDLADVGFQTPASLAGIYGTFTFTAATGAWTYTLNNADPDTQALATGQNVTDTLTVTSADGKASHNIVVQIAGANDTPPPVAFGETIRVNNDPVDIPEWLLLLNDTTGAVNVANVVATAGDGDTAALTAGGTGTGHVTFNDGDGTSPYTGGSFTYQATNAGGTLSALAATATIINQTATGPVVGSGTINGTVNADIFFGRAGNDTLNGGSGGDTYAFRSGGDGTDRINDGGNNSDTDRIVIGTNGATLTVLNFENVDVADDGDNQEKELLITFNDGSGPTNIEILNQDTSSGVESLTFVGGATYAGYNLGSYTLSTDFQDPIAGGDESNDVLASNSADETLNGNGGDDLLFGNAGVDTLNGGDGRDLLVGGSGNDILTGGSGNDWLVGGSGADRFVMTSASAANGDTITDYVFADDVIDLDALLPNAPLTAPQLATYVRYDQSDDALQVDADGTGLGATWVTVATFTTDQSTVKILFNNNSTNVTTDAPTIG